MNNIKKNKPISEIFLNKSFKFIFNLESFVDEPSDENLHQSRVSGRKLESLFEAFGHLSNSNYKVFFKQIKDIIKLLSASREADVCITLTREYYQEIKGDNILIRNFLDHLIRNSKYLRKRIFKKGEIDNFLDKKDVFEKFIRYDLFPEETNFTLDDAKNYLWLIIPRLYDKVFDFRDVVLSNPSDIKKLHKMRLKAKPLRYLLDFANESFDNNLKDLYFQIKEFVEQGGLIHDIDMLIERIEKFINVLDKIKSNNKILTKDKSLRVFTKYLKARRREEFESFRNMIYKMETFKLKEKLLTELRT